MGRPHNDKFSGAPGFLLPLTVMNRRGSVWVLMDRHEWSCVVIGRRGPSWVVMSCHG